MDDKEFVKKHGWPRAKDLVEKHKNCYLPDVFDKWSEDLQDFVLAAKYASFEMSDLKTLVEAYELVQKFGGLNEAKGVCAVKDKYFMGCELTDCSNLDKAIKIVESVSPPSDPAEN